MDQTLGLLGSSTSGGSGGGPGGSRGGGGGLSDETVSTTTMSKVEKDYMGISSEGSSYENEAEIELGLGLSLNSSACGMAKNNKGSIWGSDNVRIFTAKDLPNGLSVRAGGVSGTKRAAADCVGPTENGNASTGVSQVVGWPPIRAYRINSLVSQSKVANVEEDKGVGGNEKKENLKKKINCGNQKNIDDATKEKGYLGFIKVNMDGLPIGRKVDLNAHTCYESLAGALADMFFNSIPTINSISGEKEHSRQTPNLLDESSEFVLTYEDKEGDWMLVGDVPWGMFLCTVKRLRIMRNSEANGIFSNFPRKA